MQDLQATIERRIFGLFQGHFAKPTTVTLCDGSPLKLVTAGDCPGPGLRSLATCNLSQTPFFDEDDVETRVELLSVMRGDPAPWLDAMTQIAELVQVHGEKVSMGQVLPDLMADAAPSLPHVLLSYPWVWNEYFEEIFTAHGTVYGLQLIPISSAEWDFVEKNGIDAFEIKFDVRFPYQDLNRKSVC